SRCAASRRASRASWRRRASMSATSSSTGRSAIPGASSRRTAPTACSTPTRSLPPISLCCGSRARPGLGKSSCGRGSSGSDQATGRVLTTISELAAAPDSATGAALTVWGAVALLMVLVSVPLFSTVLPPLFDYPNHLARMHLLAEGGNAFYAVRWAALPNLAQDLIVPALARVLPLEFASRLFLVMIFGVIAGGTVWLNRVATGAWGLWPLLCFLLLYNRVFLWGFVNYLFGIGVALVGTALWLALERARSWARILVSSVVALACYFSHIAAVGFYALVILGVELLPAFGELSTSHRPALGRR